MKKSHSHFLNLAFEQARINLGKTKSNPAVGCVVVNNNSVISSGYTSLNGRPHAEYNALKLKKDYKNSDLYVTLEPCSHYGLTPPCTNLIIKRKISRVYFSNYDVDQRSAKKLKITLSNKKIKSFKINQKFDNFYESYFINRKKKIPLLDAKVAVSNDYYTIKLKDKWITSELSRKRVHLIRSQYDAIISTSKSINIDNSILNCRLNGFEYHRPNLIIIDLKLKIKKNLNIFRDRSKRKITIVTNISKGKKFEFLKSKGIKFIFVKNLSSTYDFNNFLKILEKKGYYRILVESGLIFLNQLLRKKLINNLYLFQSPFNLGKKGSNNTTNLILKRIKLNKKINVNLNGDKLYKIKI